MNQLIQNPYQIHPQPPYLSEEQVKILKRTLLSGFGEDEQESFIAQCQRQSLDPFSKQIYATRRYTKDRQGNKVPTLVPVTSVIGLCAVAVRTGHYDGCTIQWVGKDGIWKDEWLSEEYPVAAKCVVYHKQRTHPEVGIATWAGYCGQSYNKATNRWEVTEFWERLGPFMLGKCAKAQALRGAFPDQCSNLYISEELQGGISEADQFNDEAKIAENRRKEAELLAKTSAKVVSQPAARPTPAEESEPAFAEDKSAFAISGPSRPQPPLTEHPAATAAKAEPDDLDMGPDPPPPPPEPSADSTPGGAPVETEPWSEHEILGLKNAKFYKRKVGDLKPSELNAIAAQWIPKVRAIWPDVNKLQQADVLAFEQAIKHYEMVKPWEDEVT